MQNDKSFNANVTRGNWLEAQATLSIRYCDDADHVETFLQQYRRHLQSFENNVNLTPSIATTTDETTTFDVESLIRQSLHHHSLPVMVLLRLLRQDTLDSMFLYQQGKRSNRPIIKTGILQEPLFL